MLLSIFNSKKTTSTNTSRIPYGCIFAVVIVMAIEIVILGYGPENLAMTFDEKRFYPPDRVPYLEESILQWQTYHLVHMKEKQDVILLGDSSCLMGLRSNVVMQETGLKTWNLGTVGVMGIDGHKAILEQYISMHGPPLLVVYHISYYPLSTPPQAVATTKYYERYLNLINSDTKKQYWPPSLVFKPRVMQYIMLKAFEGNFLNQIRNAYPSDNAVRKSLLEMRGSMNEPGPIWGMDGGKTFEMIFSINPDAENELEKLLQLSKDKDFDMLIMIEPLPELARNQNTIEAFAKVEEDLQIIVKPFNNVFIYSPLARIYPDDFVNTRTHLLKAGALRNSKQLSNWINDVWRPKRDMTPSSWSLMPNSNDVFKQRIG